MKIALVVPDGVGIRNYLYSDVIKALVRQGHELVVWHALSETALKDVERLHNMALVTEKLPPYKESVVEKFLRESISFARLRYNANIVSNDTIMSNWAPSRKRKAHDLFYRLVEMYGKKLRSYDAIVKAEQRYGAAVGRSKYLDRFSDFLERHRPDVVFNTHQRALSAIPAMAAAVKQGIRTVSAIYSWDNLPKARLSARTDAYVVWSAYMKNEMKFFYPEIEESAIAVTGTPQFEFYRQASLRLDRAQFCARIGLDPDRKIICFSGDDVRTSPYDPAYLEDLAEALSRLPDRQRPQILFRRSPADFSGRYDDVLKRYGDVVKVSDPIWNKEKASDGWSLFYPSIEDVSLLVNIAWHCDAVYNVGSTMAHDFAMFDKPAVYIRYDQPHAKGWSVDTIYRFQHFRSMEGLSAVVWVNGKEEIPAVIEKVLGAPDAHAPDRKKWLDVITGRETDASSKIADFLTKD